jgi:hypothetical protein
VHLVERSERIAAGELRERSLLGIRVSSTIVYLGATGFALTGA